LRNAENEAGNLLSTNCSFCDKAKTLLRSNNIDYVEYDVSCDEKSLQQMRTRLPAAKSLPQLFVNEKHIGGYEDLEILIRENRLFDS